MEETNRGQWEGKGVLERLSDRPMTACSRRDVREHTVACIHARSY